jgi:4'-phosphopantetheinyl transferase
MEPLRPHLWHPESAGQTPALQADGHQPPQLYLATLEILNSQVAWGEARAQLSSEERQRANCLQRPKDQARFVLGRLLLRSLLGQWLGQPSRQLKLSSQPGGKPQLQLADPQQPTPQFNLSHSGQLVLAAFHWHTPLGVDVQQLRPGVNWQRLGPRVFTPEVQANLASLAAEEFEPAHFQQWCRLEARLKACGTGLAGLALPTALATDLLIRDVWLPEGYRGAVAQLRSPQPQTAA